MESKLSPALRRALGLCALGLLAVACGGTKASTKVDVADTSEWLLPSKTLQRQIDSHAQRFPWLQTLEERVDMVAWFLEAGEPAYPTLLELAGDPRPLVAGTALACLGSTRDPRLVPYLNDVPWPPDDALDMRLERARTHIQLGDWNYVGILIDGLEDDRPITRAICARSLRRATNLDLGYDAYAEDEDRVEGVARWREWADARLQDAMLSPAG